MFSFGQLCGWMLRFGVIHTETLGVSALGFPTQKTLTHTRKLQLPPPFISLRFCFISQELFYKLICQATQKFIELLKPSLRKQWQGNSSFYTKRRNTETAISLALMLLYQGQLQQTSSTMRYRSFSFRIKLDGFWKQLNAVHVCVCVCVWGVYACSLRIPSYRSRGHDVHRRLLELEWTRNQNNIMEEELSEFPGSSGGFTPARGVTRVFWRMTSTFRYS